MDPKVTLSPSPNTTIEPLNGRPEERERVPQNHNMRLFRDAEQVQILEAWDAEDFKLVDALCRSALADPTLPRMHRTQYNIFMAWCPGNEPRFFLNQGMAVVEEMEALIVSEEVDANDGIRRDVAVMRKEIEEVLELVIPNPVLVEEERLKKEAAQGAKNERAAKRAKITDKPTVQTRRAAREERDRAGRRTPDRQPSLTVSSLLTPGPSPGIPQAPQLSPLATYGGNSPREEAARGTGHLAGGKEINDLEVEEEENDGEDEEDDDEEGEKEGLGEGAGKSV